MNSQLFVYPENIKFLLMKGDPSIRRQVLRDLEDAGPRKVGAERILAAWTGWGAGLPAFQQDPSGVRTHFKMEEPGHPGRWITLRALRVLRWAEDERRKT